MKKFFKSKKGFTLTELIIVVAILGLLAAVATPSLVDYIGQGKAQADAANAKIIENVIQRRLVNGGLTTTNLTVASFVKAEVVKEIGSIPEVKNGVSTLVGFIYDNDTGLVTTGLATVAADVDLGFIHNSEASVD